MKNKKRTNGKNALLAKSASATKYINNYIYIYGVQEMA